MPSLAEHILRAAHAMPQGKGYVWNNDRTDGGGCFRDLSMPTGETILRAGRGTYCCGLTLEMFWRGWETFSAETKTPFLRGLSVEGARALQRAWFCVGTRKGALDALVPRGLGVEVKPSEARRGDFAQLWRTNGSGHSVLLLSVGAGRVSYLSTQKSTNGFGSHVEPMPREIFIVRPT